MWKVTQQMQFLGFSLKVVFWHVLRSRNEGSDLLAKRGASRLISMVLLLRNILFLG